MIKHLTINTEKIKEEVNFLLISDLHKAKKAKSDQINKLKALLSEEMTNIDVIIIAGDIVDNISNLNSKDFIGDLLITLSDLTKSKPTYICIGNHDQTVTLDGEKYLKSILKALKNVHCLENGEIINFKDISILGFTPAKRYYKKGNKEDFFKQYNKVQEEDFDKKRFNIFVTHDPTSIIKLSKEKKEFIKKNTDLAVTGHMHNGLMPNILHKVTFHRGIVGPFNTIFPKYAHGTIKIKDTDIVILGAVNTLINHPNINRLYSPNATVLKLKPKIKTK